MLLENNLNMTTEGRFPLLYDSLGEIADYNLHKIHFKRIKTHLCRHEWDLHDFSVNFLKIL